MGDRPAVSAQLERRCPVARVEHRTKPDPVRDWFQTPLVRTAAEAFVRSLIMAAYWVLARSDHDHLMEAICDWWATPCPPEDP